jgi:CTP synthase
VVRAKREIGEEDLEKISLFCSVPRKRVIPAVDSDNIYAIPPELDKRGMTKSLFDVFGMESRKKDMRVWNNRLNSARKAEKEIKIGIVGKYHDHSDAYISVNEALFHAAAKNGVRVKVIPIDSEIENIKSVVSKVDGIIVPGGYGKRGVEGMIEAIRTAREKKIPFLGLCYGLQMAVIERARNVSGFEDANTTEIDPKTSYPVVDIIESQRDEKKMGGTQRLGGYPAVIKNGTLIHSIYSGENDFTGTVTERHRHRFEVNPGMHKDLEKSGLVISGVSPDGVLVEFVELKNKEHPFFAATQAHPEFKSSFMRPHPLFVSFMKSSSSKNNLNKDSLKL